MSSLAMPSFLELLGEMDQTRRWLGLLGSLGHSLSAVFWLPPWQSSAFPAGNRSTAGPVGAERFNGLGWVLSRPSSGYEPSPHHRLPHPFGWSHATPSSSSYLILGLFVLLGLVIYDALRPRPLNGIPSSGHYRWAIGDSGALYRHMMSRKTRTSFFVDQANRVGPVSQVILGPAGSWFGKLTGLGSHIVILADSQQLVEVCAKRPIDFPDPGLTLDIYRGIIPNGQLALPTGAVFKHHRRACEILDQSGESCFKAAQDLRLSTMDTISDIIFGKPFGVMKSRLEYLETAPGVRSADSRPKFPALARALNVIVGQVARCYVTPSKPFFWFVQNHFNFEMKRAKERVFNFLRAEVEKERVLQKEERSNIQSQPQDNPDEAKSILSLLVKDEEMCRRRGHNPLNMEEIMEELLVYWVAGHGTMACTLAWAVKLLSNHPEVQTRLHQELINVLPSLEERPPNYSDLANLSSELGYLEATCYEILRHGRTLGEVSRTSRRDTILMGHAIPKDTVVLMPHSYLGAGSPDSENSFSPERWIDDQGRFDAQRPGPVHVFGHGARGCFGKNLALLELKLYIAMLSMEIFFDKVPTEYNSMEAIELVANHPQMCYIRPRLWNDRQNQKS